MTALTFRLRSKPPCLVDASPLAPALLAGMTRKDIERVSLAGWNESFAAADLFAIHGDDASEVVLEGLEQSFVRVGAGLDGGTLTAIGQAGDYVGESMRKGVLTVKGDVGDYAGAGLRGGVLTIAGDAGHFAGSGRAGELQGMSGGCIIIRGGAGDRAGDRMRRGLLLIEGSAAAYCASRMIAGTLVVLGEVGTHLGYLMRRGTVLLADGHAELPPTFNHNGQHELLAIRLLLESLAQYGRRFQRLARRRRFDRWLGDLGAEGMGEILIASGG